MSTEYKGIVLAGGVGTRLHPLTSIVSKQLLPVYDKPMIFYSMSTLMLAGIRNILLISSNEHISLYKSLIGDGKNFGINISYETQDKPNGIAEAFLIGKKFIGNSSTALVLGDNIFYGPSFSRILRSAKKRKNGATIFAYKVSDPERFGVVSFDKDKVATSIQEKPTIPQSSYAVTGLYFYDNKVINFAENLTPSRRGELEITDINNMYLQNNELNVEILGRGFSWLDTGTFASLHEASAFVQSAQNNQGLKIGCLEEIAWRNGWISDDELISLSERYPNNEFGDYFKNIVRSEK